MIAKVQMSGKNGNNRGVANRPRKSRRGRAVGLSSPLASCCRARMFAAPGPHGWNMAVDENCSFRPALQLA